MGTKFSAASSMRVQVGPEPTILGIRAFLGLFGHVLVGVALIRLDGGLERRRRLQPMIIATETSAANRESGSFGRYPRFVRVRR